MQTNIDYSAAFFKGYKRINSVTATNEEGAPIVVNGADSVLEIASANNEISNFLNERQRQIVLGRTLMSKLVSRYYFKLKSCLLAMVEMKNINYFAESFLLNYIVRSSLPLRSITTKPVISFFDGVQKSKNIFALTDSTCEYMNVNKVPDRIILKFIEHSKTELRGVLSKLKKREHQLFVLGVGGSGSNLLYWMSEFARIAGYDNLFKSIWVVDNDKYEFDNLPRIPFVPTDGTLKVSSIPVRLMDRLSSKIIYDNNYSSTFPADYIIVGAPDMATRQQLASYGHNWIALTHKDKNISLRVNPPVDVGFLNETYGLISLEKFYLNQMYAAMEFIKFLADADDEMISSLLNPSVEERRPHIPILDLFSYAYSPATRNIRKEVRLNRKLFNFQASDTQILTRGW